MVLHVQAWWNSQHSKAPQMFQSSTVDIPHHSAKHLCQRVITPSLPNVFRSTVSPFGTPRLLGAKHPEETEESRKPRVLPHMLSNMV